MSFRASSIYVSVETRKSLWLVARALGVDTADEAGERLLSEALTARYPAIVAHQKKVQELEADLIETLKPNP